MFVKKASLKWLYMLPSRYSNAIFVSSFMRMSTIHVSKPLSHVSLTCSNSILIDNFNSSSKSDSLKMSLLKWYTLCKRMNITTKNFRKMCIPPHMLICSHISSCRFYFDYFLIYKSYLILNSLKGTDFLLVNAYSYCLESLLLNY